MASFQVTAAVSVRLPSAWLAGTGNAAIGDADAPVASVAGTPDTIPCPPPGTESSIASDEAVAPPAFVSVKGLFSVWPASIEAGPALAMVTMGTFSIVVTEFEVA